MSFEKRIYVSHKIAKCTAIHPSVFVSCVGAVSMGIRTVTNFPQVTYPHQEQCHFDAHEQLQGRTKACGRYNYTHLFY